MWKLLSIKHFIRTYKTVLWYLIVMNINDVLLRGRMVTMSDSKAEVPGSILTRIIWHTLISFMGFGVLYECKTKASE